MLNNQAGGPAICYNNVRYPVTPLAWFMVRMTKANLKSDNDCRGTLHLQCQLYDKDIFGSEILDFRISFI